MAMGYAAHPVLYPQQRWCSSRGPNREAKKHFPSGSKNTSAFSSEVDTGSREENAIIQRSRDVFRFHGIGKCSSILILNCRHITHATPALSRAARARVILERISAPSAFH